LAKSKEIDDLKQDLQKFLSKQWDRKLISENIRKKLAS
jgi:hypothetical protein